MELQDLLPPTIDDAILETKEYADTVASTKVGKDELVTSLDVDSEVDAASAAATKALNEDIQTRIAKTSISNSISSTSAVTVASSLAVKNTNDAVNAAINTSKTYAELVSNQVKSDLLGGAPAAALDTLVELGIAITNGDSEVAVLTSTVASKLDKTAKAADSDKLDGLNSTDFARYSASGNISNSLTANAWVASYSGVGSVDHIWHNDSVNEWNFCSDTTLGSVANSGINVSYVKEGGVKLSDKYINSRPVAIGGNEDLNNYLTSGIFSQSLNAYATTGTNYPVSLAGLLEVIDAGSMIYQTYTAYSGGARYYRVKYMANWGGWRTFYDTTNLPITTTPTANTVTKRDSSGDVHTRLLRSTYSNESGIPDDNTAIVIRKNNSNDNYNRYLTKSSFIQWLKQKVFNYTSSTTLTAGGQGAYQKIVRWSSSNATLTVDATNASVGDEIELVCVLESSGTTTIRAAVGTIYVPDGSSASSHTFTGRGRVVLTKYSTANNSMVTTITDS